MKVVFLDIDGVLTTIDSHQLPRIGRRAAFCKKAVSQLNRLLFQTDARIVVSSSWRCGTTTRQMNHLFKTNGVRALEFGRTPDLAKMHRLIWEPKPRGQEIKEFLKGIPCERYVILDDDADMLPEQFPFFVQTDFTNGLTQEKADAAIRILNQ